MDTGIDRDMGSTWWEPPPNPELFGHVVVGVDGSAHSGTALEAAVAEADRRGVRLEIVHGRPWGGRGQGLCRGPRPYHTAQAVLRQAAARAEELRPGLRVSTSLVDRPAGSVLVRRGHDAALTVVGTRGHGGVTGTLLRSVSLRLAAHSPCPLLVVRGGAASHPARGRVLLGLRSGADTEAAAFAFAEAGRRGVPLTVLHVWTRRTAGSPGCATAGFTERARAEQAVPVNAVARLRTDQRVVATDIETMRGRATDVLVGATADADLVVVAAHRRPGRTGMRLGPVARVLLHHAQCPVVVVPVPAPGRR
ncbi:universal stress protein [Actinacidiphila glaucinigra]|uniref:universal stress protein n=1 Tax=Actinacidiphila glaucinigra TaxID=235986 RepID=UPI002E345BBC|nr:universal stress protein [Actinacidiphila glaucinigra]